MINVIYFSSGLLVAIIFFFIILLIIGILSNIFLFLVIIKQKLYREAINMCLLNMVFTAILQVRLCTNYYNI